MNTRIAEMESRIRSDLQSLAEGCNMPAKLRVTASVSEKGKLSFGVSGNVDGRFETAAGDTLADALETFQLTCPTGAKLAEQNDIISRIGQRQGRTTAIAYFSLLIAAAAALGQLFGPIRDWPALNALR